MSEVTAFIWSKGNSEYWPCKYPSEEKKREKIWGERECSTGFPMSPSRKGWILEMGMAYFLNLDFTA
jgi:hypothetical protein